MGFERNLVKQTVQSKILTSGENYKTVQELVSDLLSAEDEKREEEREMFAEEMASGLSLRIIYQFRYSVWISIHNISFFFFLGCRWIYFFEEAPCCLDAAFEKCPELNGSSIGGKCNFTEGVWRHTQLHFSQAADGSAHWFGLVKGECSSRGLPQLDQKEWCVPFKRTNGYLTVCIFCHAVSVNFQCSVLVLVCVNPL